jgi:ribosomal protein S14
MKQNSIKIIKSRVNLIKLKKKNLYILKSKSFIKNKININLYYREFFFFLLTNKNRKLKKICNKSGKYKSINKELKLSRIEINSILIKNKLGFFKLINNKYEFSILFFKIKFFFF